MAAKPTKEEIYVIYDKEDETNNVTIEEMPIKLLGDLNDSLLDLKEDNSSLYTIKINNNSMKIDITNSTIFKNTDHTKMLFDTLYDFYIKNVVEHFEDTLFKTNPASTFHKLLLQSFYEEYMLKVAEKIHGTGAEVTDVKTLAGTIKKQLETILKERSHREKIFKTLITSLNNNLTDLKIKFTELQIELKTIKSLADDKEVKDANDISDEIREFSQKITNKITELKDTKEMLEKKLTKAQTKVVPSDEDKKEKEREEKEREDKAREDKARKEKKKISEEQPTEEQSIEEKKKREKAEKMAALKKRLAGSQEALPEKKIEEKPKEEKPKEETEDVKKRERVEKMAALKKRLATST